MISDHAEIEAAIAALVLGALEGEEAEAVRAHLEGCTTCKELSRRLQQAADVVPLAADPVTPPARLRERIMAAAAASREPDRSRLQRVRQLRLPRPPAQWPARVFRGVAPAAIVAFALGAGLGLGLGHISSPSPPATSVAQHTMTGTGAMAGAHARVFELKQQELTIIEFSNLPQLEPGTVYELWLISKGGHPEPWGVFAPDSQGGRVVLIATDLTGVQTLAVTSEAAPNGATAPTQQPQLVGSVA
jgi:anti-sigma-K factor RskA